MGSEDEGDGEGGWGEGFEEEKGNGKNNGNECVLCFQPKPNLTKKAILNFGYFNIWIYLSIIIVLLFST